MTKPAKTAPAGSGLIGIYREDASNLYINTYHQNALESDTGKDWFT